MKAPSNQADYMTALVAEDDLVTRRLVVRVLELMGLIVIEAPDGEQLLVEVERMKPSIVVTDIQMPKMDGLTACEKIRKVFNAAELPIIVMSGLDDQQTIRRANDIGISHYLAKPVTLVSLREAVASALASAPLARSRTPIGLAEPSSECGG